jgi:hypothetical protein
MNRNKKKGKKRAEGNESARREWGGGVFILTLVLYHVSPES